MQKIFICAAVFTALCFVEWAYAQAPSHHDRNSSHTLIMRGQPEPARLSPAVESLHNICRPPKPEHHPAPNHRPVVAAPPAPAPHQAPPPPAPEPRKSFLQICLPFLSLGISK